MFHSRRSLPGRVGSTLTDRFSRGESGLHSAWVAKSLIYDLCLSLVLCKLEVTLSPLLGFLEE